MCRSLVGFEVIVRGVRSEESGGGFEEAAAAGVGGCVLGRLFFEVGEAGLAQAAADGGEVEFDVVGVVWGECLEEVVAEIGAGGARQSGTLPDFANRVASLIPLPDHRGDSLLQSFIGADFHFEFGHPGGRQ